MVPLTFLFLFLFTITLTTAAYPPSTTQKSNLEEMIRRPNLCDTNPEECIGVQSLVSEGNAKTLSSIGDLVSQIHRYDQEVRRTRSPDDDDEQKEQPMYLRDPSTRQLYRNPRFKRRIFSYRNKVAVHTSGEQLRPRKTPNYVRPVRTPPVRYISSDSMTRASFMADSDKLTPDKAEILLAIDELKKLLTGEQASEQRDSLMDRSEDAVNRGGNYDESEQEYQSRRNSVNGPLLAPEVRRMYSLQDDERMKEQARRRYYPARPEYSDSQSVYGHTTQQQRPNVRVAAVPTGTRPELIEGEGANQRQFQQQPFDGSANVDQAVSTEDILETVQSLKALLADRKPSAAIDSKPDGDAPYSQREMEIKAQRTASLSAGSNMYINEDGKREYVGADMPMAVRELNVGGEKILLVRG